MSISGCDLASCSGVPLTERSTDSIQILVEEVCSIGLSEKKLLKNAINKLSLSARAYGKILKVARTIADLESSSSILENHLLEAIQYRSLDRNI